MLARHNHFVSCLLVIASLGCNTFSELDEPRQPNNTNNTNNNTNNTNNNTNTNTNNTNNTNNNTNNNATNNATNNSNNNTNNNTNNTISGVNITCMSNVGNDAYLPLTPDDGGFVPRTCTPRSTSRFTTQPRQLTRAPLRVSLTSADGMFHGVWSTGIGTAGRIESDGEDVDAFVANEQLNFGSFEADTTDVIVFPVDANTIHFAHLESDPCDIVVDTSPLTNAESVRMTTVCPNSPYGLGYAGGFDPFSASEFPAEPKIVLFSDLTSRTYDIGESGLAVNATADISRGPVLDNPFVESTGGNLFGYLDISEEFFLRGALTDQPPVSLATGQSPGSVALVHLARDHYVLATTNATQDAVELRLLHADLDLDNMVTVTWGPTLTAQTGTVRYIELAAMLGGVALFYDSGSSWTILPIRIRTNAAGPEQLDCQEALTHSYDTNISLNDVDMATVTNNCSLRVGILTSFERGNQSYVHLEGADFPNFYGPN